MIVILVVVSLVLGGLLLKERNNLVQVKQESTETINTLSNELAQTSSRLSEQARVNTALEGRLEEEQGEKNKYYDELVDVKQTLETVRTQSAQAAQKSAEEMAKRDAKIEELEGERDDLTIRMSSLDIQINSLETQIGQTERKLAASEGDREFLLQELRRLQDEKNKLEQQFNNLAVLREQVRKLKDELSIAKRLEWVRRGLFGVSQMKGAELLKRGFNREDGEPPSFDLDIELRSDEAPSLPPETNAPPTGTGANP